jgi:hypothetical protein
MPRVGPGIRTAAPAASEKNWYDDLLAKAKNGDFNGAIGMLGKSVGGGGGGAPPAAHIDFPQSQRAPQPHQPQVAVPPIEKLIANSARNLALQELKQKSAKRRKTQDRFDIENLGGR